MMDFGVTRGAEVTPAGELGPAGAAAIADMAVEEGCGDTAFGVPPGLFVSVRVLPLTAALAVAIGSAPGAPALESAAAGPVGPGVPTACEPDEGEGGFADSPCCGSAVAIWVDCRPEIADAEDDGCLPDG
jgi:hypothetical protein